MSARDELRIAPRSHFASGVASEPCRMSFRLPLLDWLSQYRADWLRPDVLAGLTTAAVVIPKAMAYATVAGLPIEIGIYTAIVPALVYAVLGTARVLSVTTTTTIAILVGAELAIVVPDGDPARLLQALATLALMVGAILMLASVLRLGFFADFVSHPVQVGFKAGIGFVIVADQVPKLLGIKIHKEGFFRDVWSILAAIPKAVLITVVIGLGTIAVLALIEKFRPKWPAPLIVLGAAIAATAIWALQSRGVSVVGAVPSGLPSFRLPDLSLAQAMWPAALGIALMSFTETIAVGRAFARNDDPPGASERRAAGHRCRQCRGWFPGRHARGWRRLADRGESHDRCAHAGVLRGECAGRGAGGIVPVALHCADAARRAGRRGHRLFAGTHQARRVPRHAARAAHGIHLGRGRHAGRDGARHAQGHPGRDHRFAGGARVPGRQSKGVRARARTRDHQVPAALAGLSRRRVRAWPAAHEAGRKAVLPQCRARRSKNCASLMNEYRPRVLVLDLRAVFDLEYSALKTITEAVERARSQGAEIWLGALQPEVLAVIKRSPLGETLGPDRMFTSIDTAVKKYREKFGETHA